MTGDTRSMPRVMWVVMAIALLAVLVPLTLHYLPWRYAYWLDMRRAEHIAANIEALRARTGRLPNDHDNAEMRALDFELRIGYVPELVELSDTDYELVYHFGFDGPDLVYSSTTRGWRCELCD